MSKISYQIYPKWDPLEEMVDMVRKRIMAYISEAAPGEKISWSNLRMELGDNGVLRVYYTPTYPLQHINVTYQF